MTRIIGLGGSSNPQSDNLYALKYALDHIQSQGVETELINLYEWDLPIMNTKLKFEEQPKIIHDYIEALKYADGFIWSTSAYHGTLAGITKNALDYFQYLSKDGYLNNIPVGIIATAGGVMAAPNTANAMVHIVHALRGVVVPMIIPIGQAWKAIDNGKLIDKDWQKRLQTMAELTVDMARNRRLIQSSE